MGKTGAAAAFDVWMAKEYERQKERLALAYGMDEDAFHDAYLTVRDALAEEDSPSGSDWAEDLRKAYAKARGRRADETAEDMERVADMPQEEDTDTADGDGKARLARDIMRQVRTEWPPMHAFVWTCRVVCGMSYADIADASGMGYKRARKNIDNINGEMRRRYALAN